MASHETAELVLYSSGSGWPPHLVLLLRQTRDVFNATIPVVEESKKPSSRGLTKPEFAVLTTPAAAPEEDCPICLESDTLPWVRLNACKHVYHRECLWHWSKSFDTCPLCRCAARATIDKRL